MFEEPPERGDARRRAHGGPNARGHGHRHAQLHGARAAHRRRRAGAADRSLVARRMHLRGDDGPHSLRGRRPRRHRAQGVRGARCPCRRRSTRTSRRASTRGSRGRARATRPSAFRRADELAQALAGVCGMGRIRMATLDEDQVQYVMRPKARSRRPDDLPPPTPMSPRTALLAGLVLGIAMMVGLLGFFAWHERSPPPRRMPHRHRRRCPEGGVAASSALVLPNRVLDPMPLT